MKTLNWLNAMEFEIEGVRFKCCVGDYTQKTSAERMILLKDRAVLEQYATVLGDAPPRNILEFGIFQGGSPALFTLWFDLDRFVGVDISPPVGVFDEFCRTHDAGRKIRSYYETSQTDAAAIREIAHREFAAQPLDVIIDDASHQYKFSRRTFEIAFPLLRPGGTYVIEDWGWAHWEGHDFYAGQTALSMLIMELLMVCASRPDLISEVRVFPSFAFIRKSPDAKRSSELHLESLYRKRGLELVGLRNMNVENLMQLVRGRLRYSTQDEMVRLKRRLRRILRRDD